MKILVTGSMGFIGSHLVKLLATTTHEVVTLDVRGEQSDTHTVADIRDLPSISKVFQGVDVVIHLAAIPGVKQSIDRPEHTFSTNQLGTRNVIQACEEAKVGKVIYASSSSIYDTQVPGPFTEQHPILPLSPYSVTKVENERDMASSLIPTTCGLRFFTVYGENGRSDMAYSIFANRIMAGDSISITGKETCRDFTHVSTVVQAIVDLISANLPPRAVFNICNNDPHTLLDMATLMAQTAEKDLTVAYENLPHWSAPMTHGSSNALRQYVELRPVEFSHGITEYMRWYINSHSSRLTI